MEYIVFVDEQGKPTGETGEKLASHTDATKLHLAFSCYIFNEEGLVLVTRRADSKKVWPSVWTNSVCGHPSPGESFEDAIKRRSMYELRMNVSDIKVQIPDYRYRTPPYNGIIENEFCPVFYALARSKPAPNPSEVSKYRWLQWDEFMKESQNDVDDAWSWWCKDQTKQLKSPT